MIQVPQNKQL